MLFVTMPTLSHFRNLVQVADTARAMGHEVRFASSAKLLPTISDYGFDGVSYRPDPDPARVPVGVPDVHSGRSLGFPLGSVRYILGKRPVEAVHRLSAIIERWQADLVVRDSTEVIAALAAARVRVPRAAVVAVPLSVLPPQRAFLGEVIDTLNRSLDTGGTDLTGAGDLAVADPLPPLFYQGWGQRPPTVVAFAHQNVVGPSDLTPPWLSALPRRPTIFVCFGAIVEAGLARLLRILRAVAAQPFEANVIVAAGNSYSDDLCRLARRYVPDVIIERFLPQCAILPAVSLMITHGGITSVKEAASVGVPMVLVPRANDCFATAKRCADLGLGILMKDTASSTELAAAISSAMRGPQTRAAVAAFRQEMASLPPVHRVVERFERAVRKGRQSGDDRVFECA
jgi:N-glycosyltransferase